MLAFCSENVFAAQERIAKGLSLRIFVINLLEVYMAKTGLSSPWVQFYREVEMLFSKDGEINVIYDEVNRELKLYVSNGTKAAILSEMFPETKKFGRVELKITVIPANRCSEAGKNYLKSELFEGNGAVAFIRVIDGVFDNLLQYVVFKKNVVQYYTDDLGDYYGIRSTLYEQIARDVFEDCGGVFFCTDVTESMTFNDAPLGEWP